MTAEDAAAKRELDFALRSLDDLERSADEGDLSTQDLEKLKDYYTASAAELIHRRDNEPQINQSNGKDFKANSKTKGGVADSQNPRGVLTVKKLSIAAAVVGLSLITGLALAQSFGERELGGVLTGSVDLTPRQETLRCKEMGVAGEIPDAVNCFENVLQEAPDNVEARTYLGWYQFLTVEPARASLGDKEANELADASFENLNRAIELDAEYPDARIFRAVLYDRQEKPDLVCADLKIAAEQNLAGERSGLTESISSRNNC